MLAFIERPLWTKWPVVISLFLALITLNFFDTYDFYWYPAGSLNYSLLVAVYILLQPVLLTASDFIFGRFFGIPVQWNFLWKLQMALFAFAAPFSLLQFCLGSFNATYPFVPQLLLMSFGASSTIWAMAFWRKYRPEASARRIIVFSTFSIVSLSYLAMVSIAQMKPRVMAAQPWTTLELKRVRVFYTQNQQNSSEELWLTGQHIETMLGRVETALQSRPLTEKINIFVFPDYQSLNQFSRITTVEGAVGIAGLRGVLLYESDWKTMRPTVSHELTHLVMAREIGETIPSVIQEGTAVWMENKLGAGEETMPIAKQKISTATLASERTFFPENDSDRMYYNYYHAGWFAKDTIEKYGVEKWKELARANLQGFFRSEYDAPNHFQREFERIYKLQLP